MGISRTSFPKIFTNSCFAVFASTSMIAAIVAAQVPIEPKDSGLSITDPEVCRENAECPPGKICNVPYPYGFQDKPGVCVSPRSLGSNCRNTFCEPGLLCAFNTSSPFVVPVCQRELGRNARCNPDGSDLCEYSMICDKDKKRCVPRSYGGNGAACDFSDDACDLANGFFCHSKRNRCVRRRSPGELCFDVSSELQCDGFCTPTLGSGQKVCVALQPLGGMCTEDKHCQLQDSHPQLQRDAYLRDKIVCNKPNGPVGRCARVTSLKRRLGDRCNRTHDMCDALRGLSCRWAPTLRRNACQQFFDRFGAQPQTFQGVAFCTPGHALSNCNGHFAASDRLRTSDPLECRLERFRIGRSDLPVVEPYFQCMPPSFVVPRGMPCDQERAECAKGSVCRIVRGLRDRSDEGVEPAPPALYCVRELREGQRCANRFREQCEEGLVCNRGVCRNGTELSSWPEIKLGNGEAPCGPKLKCAPGLACGKGSFGGDTLECTRKVRTVGRGSVCTDRPLETVECKEGLACRTGSNTSAVRRCRPPVLPDLGMLCSGSARCKGSLQCPSIRFAPGSPYLDAEYKTLERCFDPAKAIGLGEVCDPKRQRFGPRCVEEDSGFGRFALKCLPRKRGYACSKPARVFERCDEKEDLVCDGTGITCNGNGICVPKSV